MFLIRSLHLGGAERQLVALASALHQRGRVVSVALFYPEGALLAELERAGVRVHSLDKRGRWDVVPFLARLVRLVRRERPAVLHPYLADPNLIATVLKPLLPPIRLVWGVRWSFVDMKAYGWLARVLYWVADRAAPRADLVIVNSRAGAAWHERRGYPRDRLVVIPNGIDLERFKADASARARLRESWAVGPGDVVVGMVARLDPMKDHETFLRAAARLAAGRNDVRFVCVGDGPAPYLQKLRELETALGISGRIVWTGPTLDVPGVLSAFDVATSTSVGEGFSNVVAEAMACGVPCVVTDVGDSAWIVGDLGAVVSAGDADAVADGWSRMLAAPPDSTALRARIAEHFSVDRLVDQTDRALFPAAA